MHMYYTGFDWLPDEEVDALFPEDAVPEDLPFRPWDEEEGSCSLTVHDFSDWLVHGRHELGCAQALLQAWTCGLRGADNATLADFFERILEECRDHQSQRDLSLQEGHLHCAALASFVWTHVSLDKAPLPQDSEEERLDALARQIEDLGNVES